MGKVLVWLLLGLALVPGVALIECYAQSSGSPVPAASTAPASAQLQEQVARLQQQVAEAKSAGDNAWMLVSAALVLLMTGPGLALFYGGLVRKKNVLGTMMQSFTLMALITVLWAMCLPPRAPFSSSLPRTGQDCCTA